MDVNFFEFRSNFLVEEKIAEIKDLYNAGEFEKALTITKRYIDNIQIPMDARISKDFYCYTEPIESFLSLKYAPDGSLRLLPFKGDLSGLYSIYGAILNSYGDREGAIEKYEIAYNLNPFNVINLVRLATYYFDESIETSKKFLDDAFKYAFSEEALEAAYKGLRGFYIETGDEENVEIVEEILKGEGLENLNVDVPLGFSSIIRQTIYEMVEIAKAEDDADAISYCDELLDLLETSPIGNVRKKEKKYKTTTLDDF